MPKQLDSYGLPGHDGVVACHLTHGRPMWVPPDPQAQSVDHPDLPPDVLAIQRYARGLGRDYLLFDGDQVGDLPTWAW